MEYKLDLPVYNTTILGNLEIGEGNHPAKASRDSEQAHKNLKRALGEGILLRPKLREQNGAKGQRLYKPVYETIYNDIISSPILSFYCQINWVEFWYDVSVENKPGENTVTVRSEIEIFEKGNTSKPTKTLKVELSSRYPNLDVDSFTTIGSIINQLNTFVYFGYEIEDINEYFFGGKYLSNSRLNAESSLKFHPFSKMNIDEVIQVVNALKFEFYIDGAGMLMRKSRTWQELRISNLPTNTYIKDSFLEILKDYSRSLFKGGIKRMWEEEKEIIIIYREQRESNAKREKLEPDDTVITTIKDYLKINLAYYIDFDKEWVERIRLCNSHLLTDRIDPEKSKE